MLEWQLVTTRRIPLYPLTLMYPGLRDELKELAGEGETNILDVSDNGLVRSFCDKTEAKRVAAALLAKFNEKPAFIHQLAKECQLRRKALVEAAKALSAEKSPDAFRRFCAAYRRLGPFLDVPVLFSEEAMQHVGVDKGVLVTMTTPLEPSFVAEEQAETLKLALREPTERELEEHVRRFAWVPFCEGGVAWDAEHYQKLLKDLAADKEGTRRRLGELASMPKRVHAEQSRAIRDNGFSAHLLSLFAALQECVLMKDWRRAGFVEADYHAHAFFDWLAKQGGLTTWEAKHLTPDETIALLNGKSVDFSEAKARATRFAYHMDRGVVRILSGDAAKALGEREVPVKEPESRELKGMGVSEGVATGIVRVVRAIEDLHRVGDGDVIVSHSTNPNFVVAMRRAAAVVTDEGGITCHAAIVSRELGVPCVVGTKNATRVLKDGDRVTVDGGAGTVTLAAT
jgi:phosphohistidine swiveling domain-containing protein